MFQNVSGNEDNVQNWGLLLL